MSDMKYSPKNSRRDREHPRLMWILLFMLLLPYAAIESLIRNIMWLVRFPGFREKNETEFFVARSIALVGAALPFIYRY